MKIHTSCIIFIILPPWLVAIFLFSGGIFSSHICLVLAWSQWLRRKQEERDRWGWHARKGPSRSKKSDKSLGLKSVFFSLIVCWALSAAKRGWTARNTVPERIVCRHRWRTDAAAAADMFLLLPVHSMTSVHAKAENDIYSLDMSLLYRLFLEYHSWLRKPQGAICENAALLMESRDGCVISQHRSRRSLWHPRCISSLTKDRFWEQVVTSLSIFVKVLWSRVWELTVPHIDCLTFTDTLFFLSLVLPLWHVSTAPRVTTPHLQQLRTKRWRASQGASGSFILLMQRVLEQSFRTRGISVYFLFVKASAVYTRSMKQTSPSCASPFSILRWFSESVLCQGLAKVLWFACNPPPVTHLMVWPMPTDDDWWCQSKRAQSGFGGVRSGGGGVGWGWALDGETRG